MSTTNFENDPGTAQGASPGDPSGESGDAADAKGQAKQAAGTAADEGKRVAGVAQDEVKNVAAEAQSQLRSLLDDATSQVDEQSKAQKSRLADTVRTFGDDLESMRGEGQDGGIAAQVVQQVADQARGLASHLDERDPSELLDDVRHFARRRPGTFLLGALAAGIVVGRVTRGAKAAQAAQGQSGSGGVQPSTPRTVGTTPAAPANVATPVVGDSEVAYTDADLGSAGTQSGLGARGVEISEAGIPGATGGTTGGRP
jgi:hypothetical protein